MVTINVCSGAKDRPAQLARDQGPRGRAHRAGRARVGRARAGRHLDPQRQARLQRQRTQTYVFLIYLVL